MWAFVPAAERDQLEPLEVPLEVPGDRPAEVALPDVEGEADAAVEVDGAEARVAGPEVVELAVGPRAWPPAPIGPRQGGSSAGPPAAP